jgi:hypothetical protein
MESPRTLTPLLVGDGTLTAPRDMVRALETIESFCYRYTVDGSERAAGKATLVRIMLDDTSASAIVNGCAFLNVSSFAYLNFHTDAEGQTRFDLYSDGARLEITPLDEPELRTGQRQVIRLMDESVFEGASFVSLDDEDEDE